MLAGEPAPAVGGVGTQIQAQVSTLGWRIDDLLLSAVRDDGTTATSQFPGQRKPPSDRGIAGGFRRTCLGTMARCADNPMVHGSDALALVTRGMHAVFDPNWKEVKDACSGSDSALTISRIRSNARQLKIFNSVRKAAGTPADATDEEAIELIRHLHVLSVDFQLDRIKPWQAKRFGSAVPSTAGQRQPD